MPWLRQTHFLWRFFVSRWLCPGSPCEWGALCKGSLCFPAAPGASQAKALSPFLISVKPRHRFTEISKCSLGSGLLLASWFYFLVPGDTHFLWKHDHIRPRWGALRRPQWTQKGNPLWRHALSTQAWDSPQEPRKTWASSILLHSDHGQRQQTVGNRTGHLIRTGDLNCACNIFPRVAKCSVAQGFFTIPSGQILPEKEVITCVLKQF